MTPALLQHITSCMNWDDLKIFLDVARQPKLEDAATHLQVDATTISRRIKRLETDLGLTLFERTRRGHILTPAGEKLVQRTETMESVSLDILSESSSEQLAAGRIRLGAPEGLGSTIIAPALCTFRKSHPKIDIDLIALSGFVSVPKRQADMSILLARPTAGRLKVRKLSDYTLKLYGTRDYLSRQVDLVRHVPGRPGLNPIHRNDRQFVHSSEVQLDIKPLVRPLIW